MALTFQEAQARFERAAEYKRAHPEASMFLQPKPEEVNAVVREIEKRYRAHKPHTLAFGSDMGADRTAVFAVTPMYEIRKTIYNNLRVGFSPEALVRFYLKKNYHPRTIHIGGAYRTIKRQVGFPIAMIGGSGRVTGGSVNLARTYHPSHVANQLAHEHLHQAFSRIGEPGADDAIDNYEVFGYASEMAPFGILDPAIIERRLMARKLKRFAR